MEQKDTMSENFDWFVEHYPELQKEYGDCHLVIKNCQVIGVYGSHVEALHETTKAEKLGTFNIQEVATDREAYIEYIV